MTEGLFILTVIFVAYVVYEAVNKRKVTATSQELEAKPDAPKAAVEQPVHEVIAKEDEPTIIKKITPAATTQNTVKKGLRDPKTGEVATSYNNYRFTKRWIKDALVTEGLLEKAYKNNELDAAIEAKIKDALVKLEAMDKYKA